MLTFFRFANGRWKLTDLCVEKGSTVLVPSTTNGIAHPVSTSYCWHRSSSRQKRLQSPHHIGEGVKKRPGKNEHQGPQETSDVGDAHGKASLCAGQCDQTLASTSRLTGVRAWHCEGTEDIISILNIHVILWFFSYK